MWRVRGVKAIARAPPYKLIEIDDKQSLLRLGASVVDLGAAPGGWSQVVAKRVGAAEGRGHVVAIDLLDMMAIPGVEFVRLDFLDASAPDAIKGLLGGPADLVLSDMAANATGHRATDHIKIMALAEAAAEMAHDVLKPGGAFLCKVLQGGTESDPAGAAEEGFRGREACEAGGEPRRFGELYLLARGFRARWISRRPAGADFSWASHRLVLWMPRSVRCALSERGAGIGRHPPEHQAAQGRDRRDGQPGGLEIGRHDGVVTAPP